MLFLYILSLSFSAALVGTFAHHVLDGMGFLVGFEGRMLVTGGVACAYVATQCGFLSAIRLLHPTRSAALTATRKTAVPDRKYDSEYQACTPTRDSTVFTPVMSIHLRPRSTNHQLNPNTQFTIALFE